MWSKKFNWISRSEAYDVYLEEQKRAELENEQVKAAREHIQLADEVMELLLLKLACLKNSDINATQWKGLAEFAVKTKRDALGVAEKHDVSGSINVNDKVAERISNPLRPERREDVLFHGFTVKITERPGVRSATFDLVHDIRAFTPDPERLGKFFQGDGPFDGSGNESILLDEIEYMVSGFRLLGLSCGDGYTNSIVIISVVIPYCLATVENSFIQGELFSKTHKTPVSIGVTTGVTHQIEG